jgi:uncharacterized membrane protein YphA (DoxX/SURF4 family)
VEQKNYMLTRSQISKTVAFIGRLILGGIFIYASIDKIAFPGDFTKVVQAYSFIPEFLINPVAIILPWIELIAGIFLITGMFIRHTTLLISFLLIIFLINTTIGFTTGTLQECGCFSKSQFLFTNSIALIEIRDSMLLVISILLFLSSKPKAAYPASE